MDLLPEEIINKIMAYNSHPVCDIFKASDYYQLFKDSVKYDEFSMYVFIYIKYLKLEGEETYKILRWHKACTKMKEIWNN